MSSILYYSKHCNHSSKILTLLSRMNEIKKDIHFVCIDNRTARDGKTYIILDNGKQILLPENITKVPSLLLLYQGYRVVTGDDIIKYFQPKMDAQRGISTKMNMEPLAYSMSEMNGMSDEYSYLDQSSEEMAAKGDGGTRQMHSFTKLDDMISIETPPEDYMPDKVKSNDLEKLQQERMNDMKKMIKK